MYHSTMLQTLFTLLQNLPFGLLLAALLLDAFIVAKNRREVEPAVLWLLFCSICASALGVLVTLGVFFANGDASRLHEGFWGLVVAAVASLAWMFKRGARNRGVLTLKERFYGTDPREGAKHKPGQHFWILGWRVLAVASLAAALGHLLGIKPNVALSKYDKNAIAQSDAGKAETGESQSEPASQSNPTGQTPPAETPGPAVAEAAPPAPAAGTPGDPPAADPPAETAAKPDVPPAPAPPTDADPTKTALPSVADSAAAERMVTGAPDSAAAVVTPPPAPKVEARPISRNSAYLTKIRPIFARACVKCHGVEKQKGDLALHNPDAIRAGINGKPAIIPGDPDKSRVYACIILPPDDPDFMPQKGQPLSLSDKRALHDWIKAGADLGDGVTIPGGGGGDFAVDAVGEGLPDPDPKIIEALEKEHVQVRRVSKNKRVLELDFSHSDRASGDLKLAELAPIALHIHALDFNRTRIKDADLAHLAGMKNLTRLILSRTEISDAGLIYLRALTALEQLNLYTTMVSDAGLFHLEPLKGLKKVYLWQSKVTDAGAKQLAAAIPGVLVSMGESLEKPPPRPNPNNMQRQ
jgi:hypothetical protein